MGQGYNHRRENAQQKRCSTYVVSIRNRHLPKMPRVFDVTVNKKGDILRYEMQNIKGNLYVEDQDVQQQIKEYLDRQ